MTEILSPRWVVVCATGDVTEWSGDKTAARLHALTLDNMPCNCGGVHRVELEDSIGVEG